MGLPTQYASSPSLAFVRKNRGQVESDAGFEPLLDVVDAAMLLRIHPKTLQKLTASAECLYRVGLFWRTEVRTLKCGCSLAQTPIVNPLTAWISREARKASPVVWIFCWRENATEGRVYRKVVVDTIEQVPTKTTAKRAAETFCSTINSVDPGSLSEVGWINSSGGRKQQWSFIGPMLKMQSL
jgi:hypothetical protein